MLDFITVLNVMNYDVLIGIIGENISPEKKKVFTSNKNNATPSFFALLTVMYTM